MFMEGVLWATHRCDHVVLAGTTTERVPNNQERDSFIEGDPSMHWDNNLLCYNPKVDVVLPLLIQGIPCLSQSVWQMIKGRIFPTLQYFPLQDDIYHEFPCFFSANQANLRAPNTP